MSQASQIPRHSILWLLSAQFAVILPHMQRISGWMIAIWALCAIWRFAMLRGEAAYPGKLLRTILVCLGCLGVAISFADMGSLDIAVALLILAFSLKLVEVRERRDLYLIFYLAFVIIAASFLFSQSLFLAAYQILGIVFVLTAMVATQYSLKGQEPRRALAVSLRLVGQAVPIMVVFFVVFPRIEPMWSIPSSESQATTGMSDDMAPGNVAKLAQSDELVFRVEFDADTPPRKRLYWRGMTLSHFDGRTWTRQTPIMQHDKKMDGQSEPQPEQLVVPEHYLMGNPVRYSMVIEPTRQNWLFTLPVAAPAENATNDLVVLSTKDFALKSSLKIVQRSQMQFESYQEFRIEPQLDSYRRKQETQIPSGYNPDSVAFAHQMREQAGSDAALILSLQSYLSEQTFYYSLEPPKLGKHSVDEFLFSTRKGYCEHYASAFTFLLRAVGIPSRVVIGYQGGEINPLNGALVVRQLDAHAWIEFWLPGRGWQRLDPVASVAPERIEYGMQGAVERISELEAGMMSPLYYRNMAVIKAVRMRLDTMNYAWQKKVINFNSESQAVLLKNILGDVTPSRTGLLVMAVLGSTLAIAAFLLMRKPFGQRKRKELLLYQQFCKKLQRVGIDRGRSEAPCQFADRIIASYPSLAVEVRKITEQYVALAYGDDVGGLPLLKRRVRKFNPVLEV